jgi:hypothetical protein
MNPAVGCNQLPPNAKSNRGMVDAGFNLSYTYNVRGRRGTSLGLFGQELLVAGRVCSLHCIFGPSGVCALRYEVSTIFGIIFFFSFFLSQPHTFSPRRGCPRVLKFCMEF